MLALHAVEAAKSLGGDATRDAADALSRTIEGARVRSSKPLDGPVRSAALSPDQKRLLVALDDSLHVFKWPEGREEPPPEGQGAELSKPQFSPMGELIAAIASDGTVRIWNAETGKLKQSLKPPGTPQVLRLSADGSMIAVGGA